MKNLSMSEFETLLELMKWKKSTFMDYSTQQVVWRLMRKGLVESKAAEPKMGTNRGIPRRKYKATDYGIEVARQTMSYFRSLMK